MTQGKTGQKDFCRYLVRRPTEIFLKPGEAVPVQVAGNMTVPSLSLMGGKTYTIWNPQFQVNDTGDK